MSPSRVAVLTFWDPWEAPHGGTLRTRAFCEAFAALGSEVTCIFPRSDHSEVGEIDGVLRVPVEGQTIGHQRWPDAVSRLKRHLLPMPTGLGARSPAMERALRERADGFDLLVVSHLNAVSYRDLVPGARLWLDQSDLWSSFAAREVMDRRGIARRTAARQQRDIAAREVDAARAAAVVSAAGWSDRDALYASSGREVAWLPTPLPWADRPSGSSPAGTRVLGFLANFAYHPNIDALRVLVDVWLPRLRGHGWTLTIAGLGSEDLELPDDVRVLGRIADPDEFYAVIDATAAPIRLGGGMKVKVIESLLRGRPVVATEFAVDGFPPEIRALTHLVDVDRPDLDLLVGPLSAPEMPEAIRHRFTASGFQRTVANALG